MLARVGQVGSTSFRNITLWGLDESAIVKEFYAKIDSLEFEPTGSKAARTITVQPISNSKELHRSDSAHA